MENQKDEIKIEISEPIEKSKKLIGLKQSAFKDYLAARILFLNNQLHQAAVFANTCIEKELKASLYIFGIDCKKQHNSFKLLNLLKEKDKDAVEKINSDFIKVLGKIYESRYHETLGPGYNFVIVKRKFLAELDLTYSILERKTRYVREREKPNIPKSLYEIHVLEKTPFVMMENYLLNNITKEDFLNNEDLVLEFRMVFNHEVLEAMYTIPGNIHHDIFIYEALIPSNNNQSYAISNLQPGIKNISLTRNGVLQSGTMV